MEDEIDVKAVKKLLDAGDEFVLLDCRNLEEREFVCIEGSAFVPMSELPRRVTELEPHRHQRIVVYCHHGGRSEMVCHWLRSQGFAQVQNMQGGIDAWACHVESGMPRY